MQTSNDNSDDHRTPKHDDNDRRHRRSSNNEGEDVVTQQVALAGNYNYTLTVMGNSYETGNEHSGQITGTICIQGKL